MNLSRTLSMSVIAATIAFTVSSLPAQAATLSPPVVADAYSVMLTASQAQALGVKKHYSAEFSVASATKGTPHDPWFCELTGGTGIVGQGAGRLLTSAFADFSGDWIFGVDQKIHWYANEQSAKKAYNAIVKQVKRCVGQQMGDATEVSGETTYSVPTLLTNGTKKAKDGDEFLWISSKTIDADATASFSDYEYQTVRTFGNFIQLMDIESEGVDATPFTKKQIATLDKMTDSLGDAWQAKFM
ncbi:MAG: hypothetical protein O2943_07280 [Actinomycetota bacterium]|nr:hypothetical protein [Actinomycetota bacterium]